MIPSFFILFAALNLSTTKNWLTDNFLLFLMLQRILHAVFWVTSQRKKVNHQRTSVSIRCEQGTKESSGLDVWLGRLAMVGFATAITVEISTGKGLLEVWIQD